MNIQLKNVFTEYVMGKWGDIFELDRNVLAASFDKINNFVGKRDEELFKAWAFWSPYLVPSLLLDDTFICNIVNTVMDDKPHVPDDWMDAKYNEDQETQLILINSEEFDESLWDMFFETASEGFKAYEDLFEKQALLIKDINTIQFEFVQCILNHIGIVVYHFLTCEPFNIYINGVWVNYPQWIVDYYESEWLPKHENEYDG